MSEDTKKVEYMDLKIEAMDLDNTLATAASKLSDIGKRLIAFGTALQIPNTLSHDQGAFEEAVSQIGILVEQYREAHARRTDIETRMSRFNWHRPAA